MGLWQSNFGRSAVNTQVIVRKRWKFSLRICRRVHNKRFIQYCRTPLQKAAHTLLAIRNIVSNKPRKTVGVVSSPAFDMYKQFLNLQKACFKSPENIFVFSALPTMFWVNAYHCGASTKSCRLVLLGKVMGNYPLI